MQSYSCCGHYNLFVCEHEKQYDIMMFVPVRTKKHLPGRRRPTVELSGQSHPTSLEYQNVLLDFALA